MRRAAIALAVGVALAAPAAVTPPAEASFHFMKIEEIDTGHNGDTSQQFVDLQMYQSNQNVVGGQKLRVYAAGGGAQDCTIPSDVPDGTNQTHILIAASDPIHSVVPDFVMPQILEGPGGAVCFANVDCVSWGSFSGATLDPAGTPITGDFSSSTDSMHRSTGENATLEDADDTDDSAADFTAAAPAPQNNSGSATQMSCLPVTVTDPPPPDDEVDAPASLQGLKTKVRRGKAIIRGRIVPPAPGEPVKLTFFANGSPLRKVAKAKAKLNAKSRFKKRFKVPSDSTRCKVVVRFGGSRVGKKKFRC